MKKQILFCSYLITIIFFIISCGNKSESVNKKPPQTPIVPQKILKKEKPFFAKPLLNYTALAPPLAPSKWLADHWKFPIPPQGTPPKKWSKVESGIHPEDCSGCHTQQYNDWKQSRHHLGMGPGVKGQLVDMFQDIPKQAGTCQACHAPLTEQFPSFQQGVKNEFYDSDLRDKGLVCTACHVRAHQRYGPGNTKIKGGKIPHSGFTPRPEYKESIFCATCHDFRPGAMSLNGKLIQETTEEWRRTKFAAQGQSCQSCHMPKGRHLWKGIHDKEMVESGVEIIAEVIPNESSDVIKAKLRLTNTGVGHRFPTYLTPRIILVIEQLDENEKTITGTRKKGIIGRSIAVDMSREIYDTRILPGESFDIRYHQKRSARAKNIIAKVEVWPDEWYRLVYENLLSNPELTPTGGEEMIGKAHQESIKSRYLLWEKKIPL